MKIACQYTTRTYYLFDEDGAWIPVTVLEVGPCTVLQVKSDTVDGYRSLQVGFDDVLRPMFGDALPGAVGKSHGGEAAGDQEEGLQPGCEG